MDTIVWKAGDAEEAVASISERMDALETKMETLEQTVESVALALTNLADSISTISAKLGNATLITTAVTVTGAINELAAIVESNDSSSL